MIKLILTDLDGTLNHNLDENLTIDKKNNIPNINVQAVKKAISQNIQLGIVTGNNLSIALKQTKEIENLSTWYAVQNGSFLYDKNKQLIIENYFEKKQLEKLISFFDKNDYIYVCEDNKFEYVKKDITRQNLELVKKWNYNSTILPLMKLDKIAKIQLKFHNTDFENIIDFCNFVHTKFPTLNIVVGDQYTIDITPKISTKANIIALIIKMTKLSINEVAYFGDNQNDISAFKLIPNSFCMSSSSEYVKSFAKYEVDTFASGVELILNKKAS